MKLHACVAERKTNSTKTGTDKGKSTLRDEKPQGSTESEKRVWPFQFHSVDAEWQRDACAALHLQFEKPNGESAGGHDLPLTRPDMRKMKGITPDGNCMFHSLSYVVTCSEDHHEVVRAKVLQHETLLPVCWDINYSGPSTCSGVRRTCIRDKANILTRGGSFEATCVTRGDVITWFIQFPPSPSSDISIEVLKTLSYELFSLEI